MRVYSASLAEIMRLIVSIEEARISVNDNKSGRRACVTAESASDESAESNRLRVRGHSTGTAMRIRL